jgi:hypothetical protein
VRPNEPGYNTLKHAWITKFSGRLRYDKLQQTWKLLTSYP